MKTHTASNYVDFKVICIFNKSVDFVKKVPDCCNSELVIKGVRMDLH